jgi:hypothetical protein
MGFARIDTGGKFFFAAAMKNREKERSEKATCDQFPDTTVSPT